LTVSLNATTTINAYIDHHFATTCCTFLRFESKGGKFFKFTLVTNKGEHSIDLLNVSKH